MSATRIFAHVFKKRVNSALVVSVGVDALDHLAPMLSAMQIEGDIFDVFTTDFA